ncbi:GumC family protein [Geomonas sp. RF6]|uniref:GumC family protein n=1 Tax=Geomonas sp. RF6 TaxID=2897342 RepID=UPI001E3EC3EC|nr:GumC family protein [Geomonas sp. RF6]UFS71094.1 GumC family protein [Geomonas sp. RF6]
MDSRHAKNSSYSVRDILTVLFKNRWQIIGIFATIVLIVGVVTFQLTPLYEAKSTLLLKIGREYLNKSDLNSNSPLMSLSQGELTNSEIQILTNRNSIKKVIEAVTLERMYPDLAGKGRSGVDPLEAAATRFEEGLTVEAVKQSNVIEVSFKHKDPKVSAQAVNLLVDVFKEKHLQVFSGPKPALVESQLAAYERKLKDSEENLQSYKQKNKVFSIDEQRSLLLEQRAELDGALKSTESSMRELQNKIPALKSQLRTIGSSKTPYAQPDRERLIDEARSRLLTMQIEEQQLLKKYTEENPLVVNFRKEMQVVKHYLHDQEAALNRKTNLGNSMYQTVEMDLLRAQTDLDSLKGKAAALHEQLRRTDAEVQSLDLTERNVQELKREQAINQKNYETLLSKAEEARISDYMDRMKLANISVIQEAIPPAEPVEPKKSEYMLRGVIFGLLVSLGFAFLSEGMGRTLTTPEAVERRLGLKVLASISHKEG